MIQAKENQFVSLPNNMTTELTPKDLLIYLYIKSHANSKTKESFPSLETLRMESGASINTIRGCIKNLEAANKIKIRKEGRKNIYTFTNFNDGFEPFSFKFLDKKGLSFLEKAYLVASQQYMFKEDGEGIIKYSNKKLSQMINMPESTIRNCINSLKEKGYMELQDTTDAFTGIQTKEKVYHLNKLEQAIVFILKNHDERINKVEDDMTEVKSELQLLKEIIQENPELLERYTQKKQQIVL